MSNIYSRQVVLPLTNKSGGGVIAGDVVVVDTTNNDAFTTSTAGAVTITIGVAQETIASNGTGRVLTAGYAALVNVNASVTRGNYGKTYTVAKQATDAGASRVSGTFCQFLTGGTTPDAMVYPVDLAGAALTNPMTTTGDIIVGGASGTPARLAIGAASSVLMGGTTPGYVALAAGSATRTAGDITTASTTFVDATGQSVTITTGARRCLITAQIVASNTGVNAIAVDIDIDGTRQGGAYGLTSGGNQANVIFNLSFSFVTAALTAGSHTFKLKWRTDAGTATLYASSTVSPLSIQVVELAAV